MPYGTFTYNTVQIGAESTAGTAVPATEILRSEFAMISDTRDRQVVPEHIGLLVPAERVYDAWLGASLTMPPTAMTYEQLPHLLEAGIGTVTATRSDPYTRAYSYPTGTTPNTIKTYTIEAGSTVVGGDNREMPYSFVTSMSFQGQNKGLWTMGATWMGQQVSSSTLTPALSLLAVDEAVFSNTQVYLDDTGGTIGTTQLTGSVMSAEINIANTGIMEVPTADGTNYYTNHKIGRPEITYSLTLELESDNNYVSTQRTKFETDVIQLIQFTIPGTGSNSIEFRFAGRHTEFGDYSDNSGNTTVQIGGRVVHSTTDSLYFEADVINGRASL